MSTTSDSNSAATPARDHDTGTGCGCATASSAEPTAEQLSEQVAVGAPAPTAPTLDLAGMSIVLLGTAAGPVPQWPRNMNSQALIVDGFTYIIDCGNGVVRQIVDAGIPYQTITNFFITHLHADHTFDYLAAMTSGRSLGPQPGFRTVVNAYGPAPAGALPTSGKTPPIPPFVNPSMPTPGFTDTHNGLLDAEAYWMNLLYIPNSPTFQNMPPDIRDLVIPHDIPTPNVGANPAKEIYAPPMQPFAVFEDNRVKVTAILVDHPPVFPAYAYRFDTDHGSVVFSGDTTPSPNIVTLATGADLLVHEAGNEAAMVASGTPPKVASTLLDSHTDVTQLGQIAQQADVRALALTHLISQNPLVAYPPPILDPIWITPIRQHYPGPVYVGRDLMRLQIAKGTVAADEL